MLVIKFEIWPGGSEADKRQLGRMAIVNDMTGTGTDGNYDYRVYGQKGMIHHGEGRLEGYKRQKHHPWKIVQEVLDKVFQERAR